MDNSDRLYANHQSQVSPFEFNEEVADVFTDMIKRSVPGYELTLSLLRTVAAKFLPRHGRIYDLGCSLGAGMIAAAADITHPIHMIGVDNASAMVNQCQKNLALSFGERSEIRYEVHQQDVAEMKFEEAELFIMNFTLQFIAVDKRKRILNNIYKSLKPGGALLISEKIIIESEAANSILVELHHEFKRKQGYSDIEVMQKRDAIENVLIPESLGVHEKRLSDCGFSIVQTWLQCFNFISLLAIKS